MEISAENPSQNRAPHDELLSDFLEAKARCLPPFVLGQDLQEIEGFRRFAAKQSAPDVDFVLVQNQGVGGRRPLALR
jgi:hypothetical protein